VREAKKVNGEFWKLIIIIVGVSPTDSGQERVDRVIMGDHTKSPYGNEGKIQAWGMVGVIIHLFPEEERERRER